MELRTLRDDVYRRPLLTALERLGIGPGWTCVDVGAGGGDVSVALAEIVGREGRVYAVDSDPRDPRRGGRGGGRAQPGARHHPGGRGPPPPRAGRPRLLPLPAPPRGRPRWWCSPGWPVRCVPVDGWWRRSRSPVRDGSAVGRSACPTRAIPTSARSSPSLARDAGLLTVDAWAEAPAGAGPGPVADYLEAASPRSIPDPNRWCCHRSSPSSPRRRPADRIPIGRPLRVRRRSISPPATMALVDAR